MLEWLKPTYRITGVDMNKADALCYIGKAQRENQVETGENPSLTGNAPEATLLLGFLCGKFHYRHRKTGLSTK